MTTLAEAREAILQRWSDAWTATPLADTTFAGEVGFDPPDRPWARVAVRTRPVGGHTLGGEGGRRFNRRGAILVQLFAPLGPGGDGEGRLDALVQDAIEVFEGRRFGPDATPVNTFAADTRMTGDDQGRWTTAIVEVPFDYEETR